MSTPQRNSSAEPSANTPKRIVDALYRAGMWSSVVGLILFVAADIVRAPWMAIAIRTAFAIAIGTLFAAGLWEAFLKLERPPSKR